MEQGKKFWMPFLMRFREGSMVIDAILEADQFIRYPQIIGHDIDGLSLPLIKNGEDEFLKTQAPLWDCIITDETTRKIVFVFAATSPQELIGEEAIENPLVHEMLKKYFPQANEEVWLKQYPSLAKKILWIQHLNDQNSNALERGYRGQIVFLQLVNDNTKAESCTSYQDWEDFHSRCVEDLIGVKNEHFLRNVYFTSFEL